jgi:CubicO group peptidase (beta-lactamase class C family)
MTSRKRLAALVACVLVAVAASAQKKPPLPLAPAVSVPAAPATPGAAATPPLDAADVGAWLDGFFPATLQGGKIAGAQVVVVKGGQVLVKKGYGFADVAAKAPMDVDRNLMRIGSTSKLFTWTAVMQLVQAGRIDLDADINRYLDFTLRAKGSRPITMNDLMTHRAGFEEGLKDVLATDPARLKTTERFLKENRRPALFAPGEVPAYSNYGAALAGYVVQRVSGEPFEAYVERHILAPLRMAHTTFRQPLPPALAPLAAKGYRQSDQPPTPFELVATAPAGSVSATGADMANFMIAHLQDGRFGDAQILSPATARLMHSPEAMPRPGFDTLAHGFFRGRHNGRLVIGHGGDTMVFHSDLNLLPDEGVGIFVSFNSRGENGAVYDARERLFDLFMNRYFPAPVPPTPPAIASAHADAAALAGHYENSRRVETGFLSLFYLLQQDQVAADPDGTISLSSAPGKQFREVAPGLWHEVGGTRQLLVGTAGGRRSIADSSNPVGVLQAASFARNAGFNLLVFGVSLLILLATVLAWPVAAWLRRSWRVPSVLPRRDVLAGRLTRIAAIADLLYLFGWYMVLAPILQTQLDGYNSGLDGWIRLLQVAAVVPIAGAAVGVWNAAATWGSPRGWGARLRAALVAAALLGILWLAWMGGLIGWSVSY